MEKKLKRMFWAIEINAILWFSVLGLIARTTVELPIKVFVVVGLIFAAGLQHWAYYGIYKKIKETAKVS